MKYELFNADCLEKMKDIPDKSVDLILCDLPYGTTACKWDVIIPFDELWKAYNRIIKNNGAIVLFGSEPFSSKLRMSNLDNYKYDWIWEKTKPNGFQHAKNKPMTLFEKISVFSKAPMGHISLLGNKRMCYFPQGIKEDGIKIVTKGIHGRTMGARPNQVGKEYMSYTNFPVDILKYANIVGSKAVHPTQKPVALLEYLIKTYTLENETVLDNCMGSGSTGVACVNTNRNFIGIEKDAHYFEIAENRIKEAEKNKASQFDFGEIA